MRRAAATQKDIILYGIIYHTVFRFLRQLRLILHEGKYLLIDMGKSCRTTLNALRSLGLAVSDCEGILITHEHSDHVSGLDTFFKHYSVPVYGCADTLDTLYSRGTIPPALDAIAHGWPH